MHIILYKNQFYIIILNNWDINQFFYTSISFDDLYTILNTICAQDI